MNSLCKVESGLQLFARLNSRPILEGVYPELLGDGPNYGETIELTYDINTFYTSILNEIITNTLLPQKDMDGKNAGVVMILTDGQFDFIEFLAHMHSKITKAISEYYNGDELESKTEEIVSISLKNLHIFNVFDYQELQLAILNLDHILSRNSNISLVVMDTIAAFYWSERLKSFTSMKMDVYLENILKSVQKVLKEFKAVFIYTKPLYFVSGNAAESTESSAQRSEGIAKSHLISFKIVLTGKTSECEQTNKRLTDVKIVKQRNTVFKSFIVIDKDIKWL